MSKLQDTHGAGAPLDSAQINEHERKVWHRPNLTTWKIEEETLGNGVSGPMTFGALKN